MKLAFLAGYRGQNFAGSQFQPDKRTVEGEFIAGGIELGLFSSAQEAHFRTAGRTDRGVSARRQLFTITTDKPELAIEALNFHLPDDIWCLGTAEVDNEFYPRYAANERIYRYYFPYSMDISQMQDACSRLVGEHNFSGFSKMEPGRDPVRTVTRAEVFEGADGCPIFEVAAKSFLWNMVRGMAGALQPIGLGLASPSVIDELLTAPTSRVHPAQAEGLIFWDIVCDLTFTPMRQKREVQRSLAKDAVFARANMHTAEALLEEDPKDLWEKRLIRGYSSLMKKV